MHVGLIAIPSLRDTNLMITYSYRQVLVGFTENFCIDLSGGQRKMYQRLCCTRVGK